LVLAMLIPNHTANDATNHCREYHDSNENK
jgi:hypothetical protein